MTGHPYLGVVLNAAVVLVVGYAVLYGLGLARSRAAVKLLGLAYLVGWGVLGTVLSYALMRGIVVDVGAALVAAAVLVGACVVAGRVVPRVPDVSLKSDGDRTRLGRVAVIAGAAVILLAAVSAVIVAVQTTWVPDEDTLDLWLPHAEAVYYNGQHWIETALFHPEYPPLVPVMYALSFSFTGGFHPSLLTFNQCVLGLSFVGAVLALLDRFVPRRLAFPSIALLIVAPEFFSRLDSMLPDQTLAYFVTAAVLACALWLREQRTAWLALAVILGAAGTLTKLEGASYALLLTLVVVAGALALRRRRLALLGLTLVLAAAAIEPWRLYLGDRGISSSPNDYKVSNLLHPEYLAHRIGRIPYSSHQVLDVMFSPHRWLVVLPLALFAIVAVARRTPLLAAGAAVWLLLAFAGLVLVYWIGNFGMLLRDEVLFTAHRVSATIVIVAAAMTPVLLGRALEKPEPPS